MRHALEHAQLGLEERESREVLLVAQRLEALPVLTDAVEPAQLVQSARPAEAGHSRE